MKINIEQMAALSLAALTATFLPANAVAGNYDFEAGLSYGNSSTDTVSPLLTSGPERFGTSTSSSDSDRVELSGAWYYSRLSDEKGPKSRAAFLDRASSVRLAYSYDDLSGSFASSGLQDPLPPGILPRPPSTGGTDGTTHSLVAGLRHVWKASGWYGLAGATRIDSEIDTVFNGIGGSFDTDATAYTVGIGKYLGRATALDLSVVSSDLDGYDTTVYALSFSHIGLLGDKWHYAADLGVAVSDEDGDDGSYSLGLSLFPSTELELGIEIVQQDGPFDADRDTYEGHVRWFARDHVELFASYLTVDWEPNSLTDTDSDRFAIGVNVRF